MRRFFSALVAWPLAVPVTVWGWFHERRILRRGRELSRPELEDARAIGVIDPGRVRVLAVGRIPDPLGPISALLARCTSVTVSRPSGLTLRHGIFAVPPYDRDRSLLAHELVHTMQYQRAGSLFGFMRRYIFQCLADGYLNAEWEREARELSGRIAN